MKTISSKDLKTIISGLFAARDWELGLLDSWRDADKKIAAQHLKLAKKYEKLALKLKVDATRET